MEIVKWVEAFPTQDQNSKTNPKLLVEVEHIICRHEVLRELLPGNICQILYNQFVISYINYFVDYRVG